MAAVELPQARFPKPQGTPAFLDVLRDTARRAELCSVVGTVRLTAIALTILDHP